MSFAGWVEAGGWAVWPLLVLTVPGLVLGILALGLSSKASRHYVGLGALVVSATLSIVAVASAIAIRSEKASVDASGPTAATVLRRERAIAIHSRIPLRFGLGAALVPLLGGMTGALSLRRIRKGKPASTRSLRAPSAPKGSMPLAASLSFVAGTSAAVAAVLLLAPLPGPPIALDSPAWGALEAIDLMKAGSSASGCEALEQAASRGGIDKKAMPDVTGAVSECFELRFDEAASMPPARELELLEALQRSPLPWSQDQRARLESERLQLHARQSAEP